MRRVITDNSAELYDACTRESKPLSKEWQETIANLDRMSAEREPERRRKEWDALQEAQRMSTM